MRILGIDSSGLVASAAIIAEEVLVAEFTVNNKKTHSQTLLPMIDQVFQMAEMKPEDMDAIAVAAGPGSFTGLRIGASTAKGLAFAVEKPIVSVPTLEGLAYRLSEANGIVCPLMDARRNQVYTGIYRIEKNRILTCVHQKAADIREMIEDVNVLGEKVTFLGDGVPVHHEILEREVKVPFVFAPPHLNRQSASAIAALGQIYFLEGKTESAAEHKPVYLRKSQAEREREENRVS